MELYPLAPRAWEKTSQVSPICESCLGLSPFIGDTTHPNCIHPSRQSPTLAHPKKASLTSDCSMALDLQHINYSQCP